MDHGRKDALGNSKREACRGDQTSCGSASRFVRDWPRGIRAERECSCRQVCPLRTLQSRSKNTIGRRLGEEADSLSFTDAAEWVLNQSTDQQPLHYSEITKRALECGLISTKGRTPAATMNSGIVTEIRRNEARGDSPRFVQHGRGMFGLAAWLPVEVAGLIEEKNREVRQSLLD